MGCNRDRGLCWWAHFFRRCIAGVVGDVEADGMGSRALSITAP
jgi:hypothetical protein